MAFFVWGSLSYDQFSTIIDDCEKIKYDLDKLDLYCVHLYAIRRKHNHEDLLSQMNVSVWL